MHIQAKARQSVARPQHRVAHFVVVLGSIKEPSTKVIYYWMLLLYIVVIDVIVIVAVHMIQHVS